MRASQVTYHYPHVVGPHKLGARRNGKSHVQIDCRLRFTMRVRRYIYTLSWYEKIVGMGCSKVRLAMEMGWMVMSEQDVVKRSRG
jgi:hypothetical protein